MKSGTQIAYIPTHAGGDINHPDVEFGFVTSKGYDESYFCRYWRKGHLGELRTLANSESTTAYLLVEHESVSQEVVDEWIFLINKEKYG